MSSVKYRPEIDGLRAVAVIPVILFHMGVDWIPGGFLGVDVFFVISGYLITSIILKEFDRGVFRFSNFWLRRVRRILPVLMVVVVATLSVGYFMLYGPDLRDLGDQGRAALLSYSNINFWLNTGSYWGALAENSPLLHTWSLSVEEQFYLLFPALLIALLRLNRRNLFAIFAVLTLMSFVLFVYGAHDYPKATFYLLPTRAWELGAGCLLAIAYFDNRLERHSNALWSMLGICLVVGSYILIPGDDGVSVYFVFPIVGSVLIIAFAGDGRCLVSRVLSCPFLVYVGMISYSLYLWHWPVMVLGRNYFLNNGLDTPVLYLLPLVFVLSVASFRWVEKTTRRKQVVTPYIAMALILSVSYSLFFSMSYFKEDMMRLNEVVWSGQLYNVSPEQEWPEGVIRRMDGVSVQFPEIPNADAYASGGVVKEYGGSVPDIVLLGDSHALMWAGLLDEIAQEIGSTVSFYAADGTPTFFRIPVQKGERTRYFSSDQKYVFDESRLKFLKEWKPKLVIIVKRWSSLKSVEDAQGLIEEIGRIATRVLLIEQPPDLFFGDKNAPKYLSYMGVVPAEGVRKYVPSLVSKPGYQRGRDSLYEIARKYDFCDVVPVADIFLNTMPGKEGEAWVLDGFDALYIDNDHLSYQGTLRVKSRLINKILELY